MLRPWRVTANTVIGPFIPPKLLEDRTLPEVGWAYLVKDKVVVPLVGILQTQRSRLVIPIKRTEFFINKALPHTLDVIPTNEAVVVLDTSGLQYMLHTAAPNSCLESRTSHQTYGA